MRSSVFRNRNEKLSIISANNEMLRMRCARRRSPSLTTDAGAGPRIKYEKMLLSVEIVTRLSRLRRESATPKSTPMHGRSANNAPVRGQGVFHDRERRPSGMHNDSTHFSSELYDIALKGFDGGNITDMITLSG